MSQWKENEDGPMCFCGYDLVVKAAGDGFGLLCFAHTGEAGAFFDLPKERPDNWPNLTPEQLIAMGLRVAEHSSDNCQGTIDTCGCACIDCVNNHREKDDNE